MLGWGKPCPSCWGLSSAVSHVPQCRREALGITLVQSLAIPIVTKSGVRLLAAQKPIKRPGWWREEFALFWMRQPWGVGGRVDTCPKTEFPPAPPHQSGGKSFCRQREGANAETAQSALAVILKLIMRRCDQHHLDCFKYSQSSVPGLVCSHFLEASSQNCGSLCHGYSLVIM